MVCRCNADIIGAIDTKMVGSITIRETLANNKLVHFNNRQHSFAAVYLNVSFAEHSRIDELADEAARCNETLLQCNTAKCSQMAGHY